MYFVSILYVLMINCHFLRLIAEPKATDASFAGVGASSSNAAPIAPLRSICDDYINTIGGHAYDPDCEEPEFVFKNFVKYCTHRLYPCQIYLILIKLILPN